MLSPPNFFDIEDNRFKDLFNNCEYVWEGLKNIKPFIKEILSPNVSELVKKGNILEKTVILHDNKIIESDFTIELEDAVKGKIKVKRGSDILEGASIIFAGSIIMDSNVYIGKNTVIEPGALIKGPSYIGDNTEVRQGAYIRGNVIIGDRCIAGHTTEMKTAVMLGESKAGHFAYIGDSILGKVNLGAGTKLANLKITNTAVTLKIDNKTYDTGLRKFGAILGDGVETGCNSVTTPGTLISKETLVYPNTTVRGYCEPSTIIKPGGIVIKKKFN